MVALVIAEHDNATLKGSTHHTVTAAAQCGGDVHVLVAGSNASLGRHQGPGRGHAGRQAAYRSQSHLSAASPFIQNNYRTHHGRISYC